MQAFVEGLARLARAASRHRTADVALVRDAAAEAEQLTRNKDRRDHRHVRRVRTAALIGMIDQEGITFGDVVEFFQHRRAAGGESTDMQRQNHVLRHHFTLGIHQRAGSILRFPHDGGKAGAEQRILHLLHDTGEAGLYDFEIDRVDVHHRSCVTIKFFHSSTRTAWPGQITVVQSNWSSTAGPLKVKPTSSFSR